MFGLCWSGTIKSAEQNLLLESVVGEQMEAMRDGGRTGSALSGESLHLSSPGSAKYPGFLLEETTLKGGGGGSATMVWATLCECASLKPLLAKHAGPIDLTLGTSWRH
ncbi:hypothetical protein JOQ06_026530, partial [Pogonophryne albipinna]